MKSFYTLLFTCLFALTFHTAQAQCPSKKGCRKKVNFWEVRANKADFWEIKAGVGLLATFVKDRAQTLVTPMLLGIDYRLKPNISLGLQGGGSISEAWRKVPKKSEPALYRNDYTVVGLRAAVHTTTLDRWEIYGGMMMGYGLSQVEVFETNSEKLMESVRTYREGELYLSAFLGSRYAVGKHIGVFSELGLGISVLSGGISWKFY